MSLSFDTYNFSNSPSREEMLSGPADIKLFWESQHVLTNEYVARMIALNVSVSDYETEIATGKPWFIHSRL